MSHTYNTIADTECTGVFCQEIYVAYSFRYNDPEYMKHRIGITGDYHLFAKHGDKVYMEVKRVGEIVISFAKLQQNKYWRYYYELSCMLAINKEIKNEPFNKFYDEAYEYNGNRVWSLDTAYIDLDIDQNAKKTYKIIPSGNVCYYKINPADVKKMEYTSRQGLELFRKIYICRSDVRMGYFLNRSLIYKDIAKEYAMNENKKQILNLETLNSKYRMTDDILTMIYNMISIGDRYEYLAQKGESDALILVE
jgi:hypothetical protein